MSETKRALADVAEILGRAGWVGDDRSINITGNVTNSQVAQTLTNSTLLIREHATGEKKALLEQLRREVEELVERLPPEKADEAPQVAKDLEMLVEQATSDKPNRRWYSVSAEGLLEASKWVKDFAGNLFGTVGQLGKLIWPDYEQPKAG